MGLVRRSQDTLIHWGIPGQKWGVRRWQYPDGRFTEEGKERYFGKNAEKEGYVTKNKDGSYSATQKSFIRVLALIDEAKAESGNKLISNKEVINLMRTGKKLCDNTNDSFLAQQYYYRYLDLSPLDQVRVL